MFYPLTFHILGCVDSQILSLILYAILCYDISTDLNFFRQIWGKDWSRFALSSSNDEYFIYHLFILFYFTISECEFMLWKSSFWKIVSKYFLSFLNQVSSFLFFIGVGIGTYALFLFSRIKILYPHVVALLFFCEWRKRTILVAVYFDTSPSVAVFSFELSWKWISCIRFDSCLRLGRGDFFFYSSFQAVSS